MGNESGEESGRSDPTLDERNARFAEENAAAIQSLMARMPEGYEPLGGPEYSRHVQLMMEQASQFIGAFRYNAVQIEGQLNNILRVLFCGTGEQRDLFQRTVLLSQARLSFGAKVSIFSEALKERYPDLHREWKARGLFKRLDTTRDRRNHFAHGKIDTSSAYVQSLMAQRYVGEFRVAYGSLGRVEYETIEPQNWTPTLSELGTTILDLVHLFESLYEGNLEFANQVENEQAPT